MSERGVVSELLALERTRVQDRVAALSRDFAALVEACSDVATDDEHDPEGATFAYERAQVVSLLHQARRHLVALDQAEERLGRDAYGTCERCGHAISTDRLAARPTTGTCIDCAARGWVRRPRRWRSG